MKLYFELVSIKLNWYNSHNHWILKQAKRTWLRDLNKYLLLILLYLKSGHKGPYRHIKLISSMKSEEDWMESKPQETKATQVKVT